MMDSLVMIPVSSMIDRSMVAKVADRIMWSNALVIFMGLPLASYKSIALFFKAWQVI